MSEAAYKYMIWPLIWRVVVFHMILAIFGLFCISFALNFISLSDSELIRVKPSIIGTINMIVVLTITFINGRGPYVWIKGNRLALSDKHWRLFSIFLACSFIVSIISNYYVAYNFSEKDWILFKLFGLSSYGLISIVISAILAGRFCKYK